MQSLSISSVRLAEMKSTIEVTEDACETEREVETWEREDLTCELCNVQTPAAIKGTSTTACVNAGPKTASPHLAEYSAAQ